jgi:hypothetical protein
MSKLATDLAAQIAAAKAYTAGTGPAPAAPAVDPAAATRIYTRTITVEYTLTEVSPRPAGTNRYDELAATDDDEVIATEHAVQLSDWFNRTEHTVVDDVITRMPMYRVTWTSGGTVLVNDQPMTWLQVQNELSFDEPGRTTTYQPW